MTVKLSGEVAVFLVSRRVGPSAWPPLVTRWAGAGYLTISDVNLCGGGVDRRERLLAGMARPKNIGDVLEFVVERGVHTLGPGGNV